MRYYSDRLNKFFESEKDCVEAEEAHVKAEEEAKAKKEALAAERAERAKELERLREEVDKAKKAYYDAMEAFLKDYGNYHTTVRKTTPWSILLDWF